MHLDEATYLSSCGPATSYSSLRQDAFTLMRALWQNRAQEPGFTCGQMIQLSHMDTHDQAIACDSQHLH